MAFLARLFTFILRTLLVMSFGAVCSSCSHGYNLLLVNRFNGRVTVEDVEAKTPLVVAAEGELLIKVGLGPDGNKYRLATAGRSVIVDLNRDFIEKHLLDDTTVLLTVRKDGSILTSPVPKVSVTGASYRD